ncbi:MAG: hypothetical protein HC845_15100 [Akkermansiaceae bacterium]|nr:hypothetical protein [Akkermansiaceae bacterium]
MKPAVVGALVAGVMTLSASAFVIECRIVDATEHRLHRACPRDIEQLLIKAIEEPRHGGHPENEPVVAVHVFPPRKGVG